MMATPGHGSIWHEKSPLPHGGPGWSSKNGTELSFMIHCLWKQGPFALEKGISGVFVFLELI